MTRAENAGAGGPGLGAAAIEVLVAGVELNELISEVVRRRGGLTLAQYRTLATLRGATTREPWELARSVQVSSAHMTSVLDQLLRLGLVERRVDPVDRRRRQVALTEAGRRQLRALSPYVLELEARLFETTFTEGERAVLTELVRRLRTRIAELVVSEGAAARTLP